MHRLKRILFLALANAIVTVVATLAAALGLEACYFATHGRIAALSPAPARAAWKSRAPWRAATFPLAPERLAEGGRVEIPAAALAGARASLAIALRSEAVEPEPAMLTVNGTAAALSFAAGGPWPAL